MVSLTFHLHAKVQTYVGGHDYHLLRCNHSKPSPLVRCTAMWHRSVPITTITGRLSQQQHDTLDDSVTFVFILGLHGHNTYFAEIVLLKYSPVPFEAVLLAEAAWECLGLDDQYHLGAMRGACEINGDGAEYVKLGTLAYECTGGLCKRATGPAQLECYLVEARPCLPRRCRCIYSPVPSHL
jgi:hypothetical protein